MTIFLLTLKYLSFAFLVHFLVWKIALPKRQKAVLLLISFVSLLFCLFEASEEGFDFFDLIQLIMLFAVSALSYIVTYSAIEADSPTLSLLLYIEQAGANGRSMQELSDFITSHSFLSTRLDALMEDSLVIKRGSEYYVGNPPPILFRCVLAFRELIKSQQSFG